jgi:hypothetical protein
MAGQHSGQENSRQRSSFPDDPYLQKEPLSCPRQIPGVIGRGESLPAASSSGFIIIAKAAFAAVGFVSVLAGAMNTPTGPVSWPWIFSAAPSRLLRRLPASSAF